VGVVREEKRRVGGHGDLGAGVGGWDLEDKKKNVPSVILIVTSASWFPQGSQQIVISATEYSLDP
jgi:hypothetical protein